MTKAMLSHLGICVTDVDRSRRFYCELFGFKETYSRVVNDDRFARLMQSPSWNVEVVMLTLGDKRIELVHHFDPPPNVDPVRTTNTVGYTHTAIYVPEVRGTAERAGGARKSGPAGLSMSGRAKSQPVEPGTT
jgi:glyoxylase I family protein